MYNCMNVQFAGNSIHGSYRSLKMIYDLKKVMKQCSRWSFFISQNIWLNQYTLFFTTIYLPSDLVAEGSLGSFYSSKEDWIFWRVRWWSHLVLLGVAAWSALVSTLQEHRCHAANGKGSGAPIKQCCLMFPSQTTRAYTQM